VRHPPQNRAGETKTRQKEEEKNKPEKAEAKKTPQSDVGGDKERGNHLLRSKKGAKNVGLKPDTLEDAVES